MATEVFVRGSETPALVDDSDAELVRGYRWFILRPHGRRYTGYAQTQRNYKTFTMHRLILGAKPGQVVDHINGNGLDNRRENLRLCTHAENLRNRRRTRNAPTQFKGVSVVKRANGIFRYVATIRSDYIGTFPTAEEAARAYDAKAREEFADFARLNFPNETPRSVEAGGMTQPTLFKLDPPKPYGGAAPFVRGSDTSEAAARSVDDAVSGLRRKVLDYVGEQRFLMEVASGA